MVAMRVLPIPSRLGRRGSHHHRINRGLAACGRCRPGRLSGQLMVGKAVGSTVVRGSAKYLATRQTEDTTKTPQLWRRWTHASGHVQQFMESQNRSHRILPGTCRCHPKHSPRACGRWGMRGTQLVSNEATSDNLQCAKNEKHQEHRVGGKPGGAPMHTRSSHFCCTESSWTTSGQTWLPRRLRGAAVGNGGSCVMKHGGNA